VDELRLREEAQQVIDALNVLRGLFDPAVCAFMHAMGREQAIDEGGNRAIHLWLTNAEPLKAPAVPHQQAAEEELKTLILEKEAFLSHSCKVRVPVQHGEQ
jgi:hypothetical protein